MKAKNLTLRREEFNAKDAKTQSREGYYYGEQKIVNVQ